jgi:hypothetical protein
MAEVGKRTRDPIVSPSGVLSRDADDERLEGSVDTRASGIGMTHGAVERAGNQPAIPGQDGLWLGDTGHLGRIFPAAALAYLREGPSLRVGEPELSGHVRAEDSVFSSEVSALEEKALIDQACLQTPATVPICCPAS